MNNKAIKLIGLAVFLLGSTVLLFDRVDIVSLGVMVLNYIGLVSLMVQ